MTTSSTSYEPPKSCHLLRLPTELLLLLPSHLHDIEDFMNLTSTCRRLHSLSDTSSPQTILRLCASATRTFFRPSPSFLLAACAADLGSWARASDEHAAIFTSACLDGSAGLLDLCLGPASCGLTLSRIRQLYHLRMSTINPLTDLIDKCIGAQWYATPDFWDGGVDDAYTLHADPPEAFFQLCIYGELFGPALADYLRTGTVPMYARPESRAEFVKYCIPDWCARWAASDERNLRDGEGRESGICIVDTTREPYDKPPGPESYQNMLSLKHLLMSTRWTRAWMALSADVHNKAGTGELSQQSDEEEDIHGYRAILESRRLQGEGEGDEAKRMGATYRTSLWRACFMYSGYQGLEQLARCGLGEYGREEGEVDGEFVDRMSNLWRRLDSSEGPGLREEYVVLGRQRTAVWPDLVGDLTILTNGY